MDPIIFGKNYFSLGVAESDFSDDGGLSPEDKGQNLIKTKGLLYPQPLHSAKAGDVNDIVAWATGLSGVSLLRAAVGTDNSNNGYFYTLNDAGVATLKNSDTGRDYSAYKTDMIHYGGAYFATSHNDIANLGADMTGTDYDWWTVTLSKTALLSYLPHPMVVFDSTLYIADQRYLHSWDGSTGVEQAFSADSGYFIVAAEAYQNKVYLVAEPYYNASGYYKTESWMIVWDGTTTNTYEDKAPIKDKVDTLFNFNGWLLVFTPSYMGYWNGLRIVPLFKLTSRVYKQQIAQNGDLLFFVQGKHIVCMHLDGQRFVFFYIYSNENDSNLSAKDIHAIYSEYQRTMVFSSNTKTYTFDIDNGTGSSVSRFLRASFGQNVTIYKVIVELGEDLVSGSEMDFTFIDHNGDEQTIGSMTYTADGAVRGKEFKNLNLRCLSCQPRIDFKTNGKPIKQLTIFPKPTELPSKF